MMKLEYKFFGTNYDQRLQLKSGEFLIFDDIADDLATNQHGEFHWILNFGGSKKFKHAIKKGGNYIFCVPQIKTLDLNQYISTLHINKLIIPIEDCKKLWQAMRYAPEEFDVIEKIEHSELLFLWLLSSGLNVEYLDNIDSYCSHIIKSIVGESQKNDCSAQDLIYQMQKGSKVIEVAIDISAKEFDIVYLSDYKDQLLEWYSFDSQKKFCHFGDQLFFPIRNI